MLLEVLHVVEDRIIDPFERVLLKLHVDPGLEQDLLFLIEVLQDVLDVRETADQFVYRGADAAGSCL